MDHEPAPRVEIQAFGGGVGGQQHHRITNRERPERMSAQGVWLFAVHHHHAFSWAAGRGALAACREMP